jgi:hypothetical protein
MALSQKPVLGTQKIIGSIVPPIPPLIKEPKKWTFSFRYWRQIEYFGFDRTNSEWFVSLLEKLNILSSEEREKFICDSGKISQWRYHSIDWGHKNIPIQLKDIDWIPSYYRDNQKEFYFVQFQISKALGRVVGFWDKDYVFNIVLLDPWHNIQPSKDHNYRVDPCNPLSCDYTKLLHSLDYILDNKCKKKNCEHVEEIKNIPTNRDALLESNVLMVKLTDEDIEYSDPLIKEIKEGETTSLNKIFKDGLKLYYNNQ